MRDTFKGERNFKMPKQRAQPEAAATRRSSIVTRGALIAEPPPVPRKITSVQYMSRIVQQAVNTINNKVAELENKISISTPVKASGTSVQEGDTNTQALVQPIPTTVYYPVPQIAAEKPKFPSKFKHPVTFIEDLTAYLKKYVPGTTDNIDIILSTLEDEVLEWARVYRSRWAKFEDFKKDFLENFWGEADQRELRRKIVQNTWDGTKSMLSHFISLCGQARMLTYPIEEQLLVGDIMTHFPIEVQYAWSASNNTSILQATEFLRKLDNVNKQHNFKHSSQTQTNVTQKAVAAVQNHPIRKKKFKRNKQLYNRLARQVSASTHVGRN